MTLTFQNETGSHNAKLQYSVIQINWSGWWYYLVAVLFVKEKQFKCSIIYHDNFRKYEVLRCLLSSYSFFN